MILQYRDADVFCDLYDIDKSEYYDLNEDSMLDFVWRYLFGLNDNELIEFLKIYISFEGLQYILFVRFGYHLVYIHDTERYTLMTDDNKMVELPQ